MPHSTLSLYRQRKNNKDNIINLWITLLTNMGMCISILEKDIDANTKLLISLKKKGV